MTVENKNNQVSIWLLLITFLVGLMIIVGGLTRLTDSGLSITRWDLFKGISIYSEQSYKHSPWSPYRQGVLKLSKEKDLFILYNYKIDYPERIAGGGFKLELLKLIKREKENKCNQRKTSKS